MSCFCSQDWLFLRQSAHMVSSGRSWIISPPSLMFSRRNTSFPLLTTESSSSCWLACGHVLSPCVAYQLTYSLWMITMTERNKPPPDGDSKVKQDKHLSFQVGQKFRQGLVVVACVCFMMSGSSAGRLEAWTLQSFEDLAELENHLSLLARWHWFLPNWASCQGC